MSGYFYLDVSLKLSQNIESVLPIFVKGSIEDSLRKTFGEIGGLTTLDILKFDRDSCRGIFRVPERDYVKTRAALTLISRFQDIPCHFRVNAASPVLLSLVGSFIEFDSA